MKGVWMVGVAALSATQAFAQTGDVEALDRALFANPSATAVLQAWCDRHRPGLKVRAVVRRRETLPAGGHAATLGVGEGEEIAYRRVQLTCGDEVLSEADNWYVPARLSSGMNAALAGETPFGVAVRPLAPSRRNLSSKREWDGQGPSGILRHHAVLIADGKPIAEVIEVYQRAMLIAG
jgi:chorismate-pyruvate lyase